MGVLTILQRLFLKVRKDTGKTCAAGDSYRQRTENPHRKCFICRSIDNLISKCPKPPKNNQNREKIDRFNERVDCSLQKEYEDSDNDKDKNI